MFLLNSGQTWFRETFRTTAMPFFSHIFAQACVCSFSHVKLQAGPFWGSFLHSFVLFSLSVIFLEAGGNAGFLSDIKWA